MGLPRACRLTCKRQFDRVLNTRTTQVRRGAFRVYAAANNEAVARLGLIIGKRQARRAIERNRIKRALRESFRHQREALLGVDVVVQLVESIGQSEIGKAAEALWPALTGELEKNHARG